MTGVRVVDADNCRAPNVSENPSKPKIAHKANFVDSCVVEMIFIRTWLCSSGQIKIKIYDLHYSAWRRRLDERANPPIFYDSDL